jgi:hypothetical protein
LPRGGRGEAGGRDVVDGDEIGLHPLGLEQIRIYVYPLQRAAGVFLEEVRDVGRHAVA